MKKIEAIIRTQKFESVKEALADIGVRFFTLHEVRGYGLRGGETLVYRGANLGSDYISRLQMDIVVKTEDVDKIVETITKAGRTGEVGDGKIFVYDVEQTLRIRTGETNGDAI